MSEDNKRKRDSNPSESLNPLPKIKRIDDEQIMNELHELSFEAGIEYITKNNLKTWLHDEVDLDPGYNMDIEPMYYIFYEQNIKPPFSLLDEENNNIDTNVLIEYLRNYTFKEGVEYITRNNLGEWLKYQLNSNPILNYNMNIEKMYTIYYENNIYTEQNQITINPVIPEMGLPSFAPSSVRSSNQIRGGNKTHKKQVLYKGGNLDTFTPTFNKLTVLSIKDANNNEVCKVYASSLPNYKYTKELYTKFYKIGIRTIISLQNCENTTDSVHIESCTESGYTKKSYAPSKVWKQFGKKTKRTKRTKMLKPSQKITQFLTPEIKDMTAGTISAFDKVNSVPIWYSPTLVCCYAGFGRSGTTLLLYWWRAYLTYKCDGKGYEVLEQPFIGLNRITTFSNSTYMYDYFKTNFSLNISKYSDSDWDKNFVGVNDTYSTDYLTGEVFKFEKLNSVNLFLTRINYILLYSALFLNAQTDRSLPGIPALDDRRITSIYLYPLHDAYPHRLSTIIRGKIFKDPILTDIHTFVPNNPFGLKLEIDPAIFDS